MAPKPLLIRGKERCLVQRHTVPAGGHGVRSHRSYRHPWEIGRKCKDVNCVKSNGGECILNVRVPCARVAV